MGARSPLNSKILIPWYVTLFWNLVQWCYTSVRTIARERISRFCRRGRCMSATPISKSMSSLGIRSIDLKLYTMILDINLGSQFFSSPRGRCGPRYLQIDSNPQILNIFSWSLLGWYYSLHNISGPNDSIRTQLHQLKFQLYRWPSTPPVAFFRCRQNLVSWSRPISDSESWQILGFIVS